MYFWEREIWTQTTHMEVSRENGGRDWRSAPTSQGIPVIASKPQKLGKRDKTDCPSQLMEGTNFTTPGS